MLISLSLELIYLNFFLISIGFLSNIFALSISPFFRASSRCCFKVLDDTFSSPAAKRYKLRCSSQLFLNSKILSFFLIFSSFLAPPNSGSLGLYLLKNFSLSLSIPSNFLSQNIICACGCSPLGL